jgi:hypothetical protein
VLKDISYARLLSAKKRRELLLRIIWTIALFGDFTETNRTFIELDSKTFTSQKIYRMYDVLENCFMELKKHKIYCKIIPLDTNRWLTPKGGLRDEGWKIIMSFGSDITDLNTLGTFKKYVTGLNDKYDKKAFIYFNRADLNLKQT